MIVTEYHRTRSDGVVLNRTYSDAGFMIEREGVRYSEAIDPVELNRQYIETGEPIDKDADQNEATETDYQNALRDMGVTL